MATTKNLLINILLIFLAFTPSIILNGLVYPYKRGFYCDDETIRKPKLSGQQIPAALLAFFLIFIPTLMIIIVNWIGHNKLKCKQQEHSALKLSLNDIFLLFFGLGVTMLIVDTAKFSIGRHRPNFYKSCEPRIAKYDIKNGKTLHECQTLGAETLHSYIVDFECTVQNIQLEKDLHLSFMSGHAALMMFTAVYVSIILAQRLRTQFESTVARLIVGAIAIVYVDFAVFVGFTRISDYMHHPTDVLTGLITGTIMAIFVKYFIDKNYSSKCLSEDEFENRFQSIKMKTIEDHLPEIV